MKKIKVALVDDHQLFRNGLSELVNDFPDFQVVLEADNGKDLMRQLDGKDLPDIVLLDINMKEMDGYETASWLKQNHPEIRILVLSMYENENAIIRMLQLGAVGYILKDIHKLELEKALLAVAEKGFYCTDRVTGKLIHAMHNANDTGTEKKAAKPVALQQREIDFLKLVCTELTYKNIADEMHLSVHTIDGYRDTLFEKLQVRSRVGLVLYAIKNKIVIMD